MATDVPDRPRSALHHPGFRWFVATYAIAMMADNIEHVISYWVAYRVFHSEALGGFAVISHWVPFLVFSVWVGSLNDRFDSRRIIQCGQALFIVVSVGWGIFFITDSLTLWGACVLLTLHGCAGVLWQTSSQMLLYDIVGPELLPSAVRLNATARYLGVLVGPGVGGVIMVALGPVRGIFLNTAFYLPIVLWMTWAPYGRHYRGTAPPPRRAVRGLADILQTLRDIRPVPVLGAMLALAGCASALVGNSYQAQMPKFAIDLGHGEQGTYYSMLLGADAAGALTGGFLLETSRGWLATTPRNAIALSLVWAASLTAFAVTSYYPACLAFLFCAGFFELSFSSMAQTIVQIHAPNDIRGRVLGLYNMVSLGLRAFSGVTVGLIGSLITVRVSLALATACFGLVTILVVGRRARRRGPDRSPDAAVP